MAMSSLLKLLLIGSQVVFLFRVVEGLIDYMDYI